VVESGWGVFDRQGNLQRNVTDRHEKEVLMTTRALLCILVLAFAQTAAAIGGFNRAVLPSSANAPGALGSQFRTKVTILNATSKAYTITVTLYNSSGQTATGSIPMAANQFRAYDNFLAEVLNYSGTGAIVFESGSEGADFIVTEEVYNDLGAGRYKTVVSSGSLLENSLPDFDSFSLGIIVDANNRTNIGYFNDGAEEATITADVFNDSGTVVKSIEVTLAPKGYGQQGLSDTVSNGYVRWRVTGNVYCYAVVVDNRSADGTFIAAADYLP
jgi:hypothetical protein